MTAHEELKVFSDNNPIFAKSLLKGVIRRAIDEHEAQVKRVKDAEQALEGRLGDNKEAIVWACQEYVLAENALPDCFDTESYRLSDAVDSVVEENKNLQSQLTALQKDRDELQSELNKWKSGCLANAESEKASLRVQDNQRLEILELKAALDQRNKCCAEMREALKSILSEVAECDIAQYRMNHKGRAAFEISCGDAIKAWDALSSDCGKGYASPEQVRVLKEACGKLVREWEKPQPTWSINEMCKEIKQALDLCDKM